MALRSTPARRATVRDAAAVCRRGLSLSWQHAERRPSRTLGAAEMGCGASKDGELLRACRQGELDAARAALSGGADPNGGPGPRSAKAEDELPLAVAALGGHLPLVELLLDRGADVNVRLGRVRRAGEQRRCACHPNEK